MGHIVMAADITLEFWLGIPQLELIHSHPTGDKSDFDAIVLGGMPEIAF